MIKFYLERCSWQDKLFVILEGEGMFSFRDASYRAALAFFAVTQEEEARLKGEGVVVRETRDELDAERIRQDWNNFRLGWGR